MTIKDKSIRVPSNVAAQSELDEELMREALDLLKRSADELHRRALCDWPLSECQKAICEQSYAVIVKLEERLLNE